jgi:5'-3' exonuclease
MGIPNLTTFIRQSCGTPPQLSFTGMKPLVIAVDASIFLHRFLSNAETMSEFIKNVIDFVTRLKLASVEPVFVLDGQSKDDKQMTHMKRRKQKNGYRVKISNIKEILATMDTNTTTKLYTEGRKVLEHKLQKLYKKCKKIGPNHIDIFKRTLTLLGVLYIHSKYEADPLCAELVKKGFAHACMSNDNDLLAYGCPVTFQNYIFKKELVTEYNLIDILNTLGITQAQFTDMCILLGTDYNKPIFGIKPDIALDCIKTYGNIENILLNINEINSSIMTTYKNKYPKIRKLKIPDDGQFDFEKVRAIFNEPIDIASYIQDSNNKDLTETYLYSSTRIRELETFLVDALGMPQNEASSKVRYITQVWLSCVKNINTADRNSKLSNTSVMCTNLSM